IALLNLRGQVLPALAGVQLAALVLGLVLTTIGLLASLGHLGKPFRAWRAFSQWRTSWLSREGVMAIATLVPALAVGALLLCEPGTVVSPMLAVCGIALALFALGTVVCTAMIYASLKPIPAWRHPLVVPVYLLFALLTGLALPLLAMASMLRGQGLAGMLPTLVLCGLVLAALKWLYWRAIDAAPAPATRGAAVGLPDRDVQVFERPHTEANYITREMVFQVARRHALRLRLAAVAGLVAVPLLATALLLAGWVPVLAASTIAALGLLACAVRRRWLCFSQARHEDATCRRA